MNTTQQGQARLCDVLIIGTGIAGLTYALRLSSLHPQAQIALISKNELALSNSVYAQGGIAAASDDPLSLNLHLQDTLAAGDGLCYLPAVREIIENGQDALQFLLDQGVRFDTNEQTELERVREGGHSESRIYHYGDTTGEEIIRALSRAAHALTNLQIYEHHTAVNLILSPEQHLPGHRPEVLGAYVLENSTGLIHTFLSQATVLATGGAGKIYRYTSNPDTATGDGIAMAYRAGARVGNLEFYQFHPTIFYHEKLHNFLISETLRGEGAYLRSPQTLERFMIHHDPKRMELSTRDIVARAIFTEIENNHDDYVWLDIRHQPADFLKKRFPHIYQTLFQLGLDLSRDLIPVVPGAHYLCGGILADISGRTDLPRLYAIGETAFTGLHGANRLASNSLLEGVVMGKKAAEATLSWLQGPSSEVSQVKNWASPSLIDTRRASQINAHWGGLRGEMTSYAGIVRTGAGLKDLLKLIRVRKAIIEEYYQKHLVTKDLIELRNIIVVAELIVKSALKRRESRGGHYREDYPHRAENSFPISFKSC